MEHKNLLKTGAQFKATDKIGNSFRYEVVGIDLDDLISGTGCAYIVLKNLDTGIHTCVEAAWFQHREITDVNHWRNTIEVPCTAGTLCAECGGNFPRYPKMFTYLRRKDGVQIDICAVEGDGIIPEGTDSDDFDGQQDCNGGLHAFLYGDTSTGDWTKKHVFSAEELNIAVN